MDWHFLMCCFDIFLAEDSPHLTFQWLAAIFFLLSSACLLDAVLLSWVAVEIKPSIIDHLKWLMPALSEHCCWFWTPKLGVGLPGLAGVGLIHQSINQTIQSTFTILPLWMKHFQFAHFQVSLRWQSQKWLSMWQQQPFLLNVHAARNQFVPFVCYSA